VQLDRVRTDRHPAVRLRRFSLRGAPPVP
jgi:hypothetical protein